MDASTTERLLEINNRFYSEHGGDFSATRRRLQPGVQRVLEGLEGDESILDLGCGNGELARALSKRGHHGPYLGLDFSRTLLDEAQRQAFSFPVQFAQMDLAQFSVSSVQSSVNTGGCGPGTIDRRPETGDWGLVTDHWPLTTGTWSLITAFAVLHHIPGRELRLQIVAAVRELLAPNGSLIQSNWQFLNSPRWKARIQPWESLGIRAEDVEPNDYLLDWRHGAPGLRYVHYFEEKELEQLARESGFEIVEAFHSDGENQKMSLYQTWKIS